MLPEMAAPGAEMRPSLIVRVEELDGSQLPLLVTTVTFHWPSNGCPAKAGVAAVTAKRLAQISGRMRLRRMNQVPQLGDGAAYWGTMWPLVRCNNPEDY
jgi:hypothetical protein